MTQERARQIQRLIEWQAFGCLSGEPRPEGEPETEAESEEIKRVWATMNSWTCKHDAVMKMAGLYH